MAVISLANATKDYGNGRGIFNVSCEVKKGEVFGFLGPNGAGKTTTIRILLGFIKANKGKASILDYDCWQQPAIIQRYLGYLPGEIAFPVDMTGSGYLKYIADMRGLTDHKKTQELLKVFDLDPGKTIRKMSKGMKQKLGLVSALMHDPEVLVLDEPTSGLDPLMQSTFTSVIREERNAGKTVFMSSHLFDEVEDTCDKVGIIKQGRLIDTLVPSEIRHSNRKMFKVEFLNQDDYLKFQKEGFILREAVGEKLQVIVEIDDGGINLLIRSLGKFDIKYLREIKQTLEDHFMAYYKGDAAGV